WSGIAPASASKSRAGTQGRSALTTRNGAVEPARAAAASPAATAAPWPRPSSATTFAAVPSPHALVTRYVVPTASQAASTSASIASRTEARAASGNPASLLLPSVPRKGTTTVGIARRHYRRGSARQRGHRRAARTVRRTARPLRRELLQRSGVPACGGAVTRDTGPGRRARTQRARHRAPRDRPVDRSTAAGVRRDGADRRA